MGFGLQLCVLCLGIVVFGGVSLASDVELLDVEVFAISEAPLLALGSWEGGRRWGVEEFFGLLDVPEASSRAETAGTHKDLLFDAGDDGAVTNDQMPAIVSRLGRAASFARSKTLRQLTPEEQPVPVPYYIVVERIEADTLLLETPQGMVRVSQDILPVEMLQEGCVFEIVEAKGERRRRLHEASERVERMQRSSHVVANQSLKEASQAASRAKGFEPKS